MKELERNNLCSRSGDILGYLYGEISVSDSDAFELHLADCVTCIDDFAELSQSRYPVYEWKRIDFDPLETPSIAIPFPSGKLSLFERLSNVINLGRAWGFAGVAAAILIAFSAGYIVFVRTQVDSDVAHEVDSAPSPELGVAIPSSGNSEPSSTIEDPSNRVGNVRIVKQNDGSAPKLVKATADQPRKEPKPKTSQQAVRQTDPLPVLNTSDDFEDNSLRLADLFEDIETSE